MTVPTHGLPDDVLAQAARHLERMTLETRTDGLHVRDAIPLPDPNATVAAHAQRADSYAVHVVGGMRELFERLATVLETCAADATAFDRAIAICAFCGYVVVNSDDFSAATVTSATSALLVEALGLVATTWKGTLGAGPKELEPTTAVPPRRPPSD
jgi:hypothetical protein